MKELSIEQKAQKYDNLIKRLKDFQSEYKFKTIDEYFPELKESKESEDDRTRKELIEQVVYIVPNNDEVDNEGNVLPTHQKRIDKYRAWLENQRDKDKLIQELGEYKVKYTQEVLNRYLNISNKDGERLRKTTIDFLKEFADKGYENAVECIDWLEKQGEQETTDKAEPKFHEGEWITNGDYTWKPTEEQMKALEGIKDYVALTSGYWEQIMTEIIEQLKQL